MTFYCPDCRRPVPGVNCTRCCASCLEKRLAALRRPPVTPPPEGDERERVEPLGGAPPREAKYHPPAERAARPTSSGRRVIRKAEGMS